MFHFRYIILLFLLCFAGKDLSLSAATPLAGEKEGIKIDKTIKSSKIFNYTSHSQKFNKLAKPKKLRGLKGFISVVKIENIENPYCFSECSITGSKDNYSLLRLYSHGQRGPPTYSRLEI